MIALESLQIGQAGALWSRPLSVVMERGQMWALLGPNGVGKSTLLVTLAGLLQPLQGRVLLHGQPLADFSPMARARALAYLPQGLEAGLDFSVDEAIGMGAYCRPEWSPDERAQHQSHWMQALGLTALAGHSINRISGGERRRVELATCLMQGAEVLLLDEPSNDLDLVYKQRMLSLLADLQSHTLVVLASHDLELIRQHASHAMLMLADGSVQCGEMQTVLSENNLRRLYACE